MDTERSSTPVFVQPDSAAPVPPPSPGSAGAVSAHSPLPDSPVPGRPRPERRLYKKRVGDWLTYDRAEELAYAVKHYWMDRGYMGVETYVVPQSGRRGGETMWCVRSNAVNGLPPKDAGFLDIKFAK